MKRFFSILLIIALSLSILVISIEINAYNKSYFMNSYQKHKTSEVTGKSTEELGIITDDIILHLKGQGGDELLSPHFNEKEVLHMRDVQDLFDMARVIKYSGFIVSIIFLANIIYKKDYLYLAKTLLYGPLFTYSLLLILALLASRDFTRYFTYFHHIFFSNDLWILNPQTDMMIQMLPEDFFMGMAIRIMLSFLIILSILQIVGILLIRKGSGSGEKLNRKD
ncbi:MAG TPA: TIGR01906 family membrane protein [Tissierellaceae bacterium]|nr:TIGR01906 family membrane protein [Tissierellaceae bacterium]